MEHTTLQFLMKKTYIGILWLFTLVRAIAHAENDFEESLQSNQEPLFVSLGSVCEAAHMLRFCELRKLAFPFDWIVSQDGEALIEMLTNDFKDFLNDKYFVPFGPAGHLLNTHYHLEFLHDGNFNTQFSEKLANLKQKYSRRIQRFKDLDNYAGKVFFIRNAYVYSMTDPHRFYHFAENLEISPESALKLYQALKLLFPKLNFELLIINNEEGSTLEEQKKIDESVNIFKADPFLEQSEKIEKYRTFFYNILSQNT